jgi:hypothetical protein
MISELERMWKEAVVAYLRKTTKTLSKDSRSPGGRLNPGPPEYDA